MEKLAKINISATVLAFSLPKYNLALECQLNRKAASRTKHETALEASFISYLSYLYNSLFLIRILVSNHAYDINCKEDSAGDGENIHANVVQFFEHGEI